MKKINILIIDDEETNRLLIKLILRRYQNFLFWEAHNGRVGIEILENQNIDFVFMDINMPEMNGIETTYHIRNKMPSVNNIPIIAVTAQKYDINEEVTNYSEHGFTDVILKPVSLEKLNNIISHFLNVTLI